MTTTTRTKTVAAPIAVIVGGLGILGLAAGIFLLRVPAEPTLTDLTKQTIIAADHYTSTSSKTKTARRADFVKVAEKRLKKLRALITTHPDQVLAAAIPQTTLANIPKELQPYTEKYITAEGSFGIITSDNFENQTSKDWPVFNTKDGKNTYYLYSTGKQDIPAVGIKPVTGTVSGVLIDSSLALTPPTAVIDESIVQPDAVSFAPAGSQNTLVVRVNFSDYGETDPTTEKLQADVFDLTGTTVDTGSLNSYYQENSYNKISVTGTAIGPYTINLPVASGCSFADVVSQTIVAVDSVVDFTQYQHMIVIAPFSCAFAGIATYGIQYTADGVVSMSLSMIDTQYTTKFVVAHEFGHQLGNMHAGHLDCGADSLGSDGYYSSCVKDEYGDKADVMGEWSSTVPHFNAAHMDNLGWLSSTNVLTLTQTADLGSSCVQEGPLVDNVRTVTCTIEPIESCLSGIACRPGDSAPTGLKAIRLQRGASNVYVEYRQPLGFDAAFIADYPPNDFTAGALIHVTYDNPSYTALLDTTTSATNLSSTTFLSLLPGLTFTDPISYATITTLSATPSALTVRITTGRVDTVAPMVSIYSLPSGILYFDTAIDVLADARDYETGISKVEFYNGTTLFSTDTVAPYTAHLDTSSYPAGTVDITAKAYDGAADQWGPANTNSATISFIVNHTLAAVTVLKGIVPISNATVQAYDNSTPPVQIGQPIMTNANGQALFFIAQGTNVKYIIEYGPGYSYCQSNETGYALAPHNETVQLPAVSSISFWNGSGTQVMLTNFSAIDQSGRAICDNLVTGGPLYIQPGLSVRFRFQDATLGKLLYTPFYTTPFQVRFCYDAAGVERTCPSVSIIPDFTHLYAKDGFGCDDYYETFSIPFVIQNGSSAVTAKPRGTVENCGRDQVTDPWRCSAPVSATITPTATDLIPNQEASFTLTTPPGSIRGGEYYRYSFSEDWGSTVVSEVTESVCHF